MKFAQPAQSTTATTNLPDKTDQLHSSELIEWGVKQFGDQLLMSTSFGIQSAVTLHMASTVRPGIPVIWIDTGYLPQETYQYAIELTARLNLNLKIYRSELQPETMEKRLGQLWANQNADEFELYDWIRKVEPMQRALAEWQPQGWISGIRADQTSFRKSLKNIAWNERYCKLHPLLNWTSRDIDNYMQKHDLPAHPLAEKGYTTVGDKHSSRPLSAQDQNDRDTRFGGLKQECGLHTTLS